MASISYFLMFGAILMLIGCVQCEFVGHGKHELDNGTIVQLNTNTRIAEPGTDLEPYRNQSGACNVTMDKEGNIILWYTKNSTSTENGCSLDLVTKNESQVSLEFGISHSANLIECIMKNEYSFQDNIISFSYSMKGGEFEDLKNGPKEGNDSYCNVGGENKCRYEGGSKCWNTTAFYSIGWVRNRTMDSLIYYLEPVGEVYNYYFDTNTSLRDIQNASFKLAIKGLKFRFDSVEGDEFQNLVTFCYKNEKLQEAKEWEIADENYIKANNQKFTHLFTFHVMPIKAMRESLQDIWFCNNNETNPGCEKDATMLNCDKMFIRFDKEHFRILVPDNSTTEDGISTNGRNKNLVFSTTKNVEKTDNEDTKQVGTTQDMRRTKDPKTTEEASRISKITIFFIICAIIILPEQNQSRTKPEQSLLSKQSASTTTSNKDSYADIYLSANVSEDRFKNPTTVVETQYNQDFNEVDTVVDTQIEPNESSNFKTGVKASNTLVNTKTGVEVLNKDFTKSDRTVPDTLISTNTVHEDPDIPNTKTGIEGIVIRNTSTGVEVPDSFYEE
uniref:CUB domain-containing protein n=1 Tax=Meloidogyne hapla TaxID=6305 RepID=A0A1I8C1I8_MELHA